MIHINLLAGERSRQGTWLERMRARWLMDIATVVLLASGALMLWRVWWLERQSLTLAEEIHVAQQRADRVTTLLDETKTLEAVEERLVARVSLIEGLRRHQQAPAHLLAELGRGLPDRLWLVAVDERAGDVQIEGRASSLAAVADFVANLGSSGRFALPIEIVEGRREVAGTADLVKFSLKARFLSRGSQRP